MSGLMDLIQRRRTQRFASGGYVVPAAATKFQQAQDTAERDAQVRGGAFSTVPPPLPTIDESKFGQVAPGAVTPDQVEMQETGAGPRLLEAGSADLTGGVKNAIAATAQMVGNDNVAGAMRRSAQLDAERAAKLTSDQINDVHQIYDPNSPVAGSIANAAKFGLGQAIRGLPTLAAMGGAGIIGRALGAPALAGVAVPSFALNTGAAYSQANDTIDQQAASGQLTPEQAAAARAGSGAAAFKGGAGGALVDTLAFGYASKLAPFAKGLLADTVAKSLPGHIVRTLGVEGLTGAARQYANDVAVKTLLNDPNSFGLTPEDIQGLESAAAQNAAATAPLAVPGHFGRGIVRGVDSAMDAAGRAYQRARPAIEGGVQQAVDTAQPHVQGAMDKFADLAQSAQQAAQPFIDRAKEAVGNQASQLAAGLRAMAEAAKQPAEEGTPQQSLAGRLSPEAKTIRDSLGSDAPEATLLAKRLEQLITVSPAKFEDTIRQPDFAQLIDQHFGETPEQFSDRILKPLRGNSKFNLQEPAEAPDRMQNAADLGMAEQAGFKPVEGIDAEEGAHLANLDTSDVLNAIDHPNDSGQRQPQMTPEAFGKSLVTDQQKNAGSKAGGNAWVIVKRETKDPDTGAVLHTEEQPKQINFINLAKAWGPSREGMRKGPPETEQAKFDANFKDGLSSMLSGWQETGEYTDPKTGEKKTAITEVSVQPAKQHTENGQVTAVPREDMQGWLRPDSVVGNGGEPRTFSQVEEAGKANQPVDVPGAIEQYHERVAAAAPEKKQLVQTREANTVAKLAVEKIKDGLEDLEPTRTEKTPENAHTQDEVIQASIDYASDPTQRPIPRGVPSYLRMLPADVLEHGKARLISELDELNKNVVQNRLRGEQETSVDNPEMNESKNDAFGDKAKSAPVTEDMSGQHIDMVATQRAGKDVDIGAARESNARFAADRTPVGSKVPLDEGVKLDELKRKYAEAKTVPGKAIARRALERAQNVASLAEKRSERTKARAQELANGLSEADRDTLQNDRMSSDGVRSMIPASMRDEFHEWVRDSYGRIGAEEKLAPENLAETEHKFLEETADGDDPRAAAMAKQIIESGRAGPKKARPAKRPANP